MNKSKNKFRIESDSMGEVKIPKDLAILKEKTYGKTKLLFLI